jgi:PAS domain S-box-containing protein
MDGVIFVSEEGTVNGMNLRACQILGTERNDAASNIRDLLPGSGLDLSRIPPITAESGEDPYDRRGFELKLDHSSLGFIEVSTRRLPGPTGGFIVLLRDVTKQWKDETAIKESEEKYRAAVEQSAENIYLLDVRTNRIIETNTALQELLGYSAEEMRGMAVSQFVAHDPNNISHQVHNVIEKGRAIIGERIYKKKDGGHVDVEVSASHLKYGERSVLCIVSRDITERNRARRQLIEERNRAELYLDLLAHDIGNLHHGMLSGVEMYEMVKGDEAKRDKAVNMVSGLLKRSVTLVDNVLKLSKLKTKPFKPEPVKLKEMIERAVSSVVSSFPEKKVDVVLYLPEGEVTAFVEPIVEEAFYNIVHNAIKFQMGSEPKVEILVEQGRDGTIRASFSDHGPGIPPESRKEIFDRFVTRPKQKHTGLGMSITKALVERSGGRVYIKDRVEGDFRKGTVVVVEVPSAPIQTRPPRVGQED